MFDSLKAASVTAIPSIGSSLTKIYYHALFGVVLPLLELRVEGILRSNQVVTVPSCGIHDRLFSDITRSGFMTIVPVTGRITNLGQMFSLESFDCFLMSAYKEPLFRPAALTSDRLRKIISGLEGLAPPMPNDKNCRILVIDRSTSNRCVPNMADIADKLSHVDSVNYSTLEEKSLPDQIRLFRSAEIVIAQHGSGLANLVWGTGHTKKLIEIIPPEWNEARYYGILAKILNLHYCRVNQTGNCDPVSTCEILEKMG